MVKNMVKNPENSGFTPSQYSAFSVAPGLFSKEKKKDAGTKDDTSTCNLLPSEIKAEAKLKASPVTPKEETPSCTIM
ncbi:MAG: hypothetical protein P1U36_09640 [Legionellaceae bacterium]|nr:hypothetical protein [Legionellaceae bacterium]